MCIRDRFTTLPEAFKQLQTKLLTRAGGDREMVEVLSLVLHYDEALVLAAIEETLALGVASKQNILNILRRMISPAPVSYTHLDVYKRQT